MEVKPGHIITRVCLRRGTLFTRFCLYSVITAVLIAMRGLNSAEHRCSAVDVVIFGRKVKSNLTRSGRRDSEE